MILEKCWLASRNPTCILRAFFVVMSLLLWPDWRKINRRGQVSDLQKGARGSFGFIANAGKVVGGLTRTRWFMIKRPPWQFSECIPGATASLIWKNKTLLSIRYYERRKPAEHIEFAQQPAGTSPKVVARVIFRPLRSSAVANYTSSCRLFLSRSFLRSHRWLSEGCELKIEPRSFT
jgi:hypothetical protein